MKGYYILSSSGTKRSSNTTDMTRKLPRKLLDEGWLPRGADGTRFNTVLELGPFASLDFAEIAAAYWAEIGVDVEN